MRPLTTGPALFVQPHYDDVPLSYGGTVAALAEGGYERRIATVFASELVDAMVGDFAAWKHARWKLTDPETRARGARRKSGLSGWERGPKLGHST